jgi:hypothetical protein
LPAIRNDPASVLELIARAASDPAVDVAKMQALVAMHRELAADQARREYNQALNRAQEEIQPVARTTENTITHSFYAKLEEVDKAIRPIYLKYEFALSYNTVEPLVAGNVRLECRCSRGGHVEKYYLEAPADTHGPKGNPVKTMLHGIGSTDTFLRRYLTCSIFNVVFRDMDNDGNGALSQDQVDYIIELMGKAKVGPKFLQYMKAQSVEKAGSLEAAVATIAAKDYRKAVATLDEQIAKKEKADA